MAAALLRDFRDREEVSERRSKAKEHGEKTNKTAGRVTSADKIEEFLGRWSSGQARANLCFVASPGEITAHR